MGWGQQGFFLVSDGLGFAETSPRKNPKLLVHVLWFCPQPIGRIFILGNVFIRQFLGLFLPGWLYALKPLAIRPVAWVSFLLLRRTLGYPAPREILK